MTLDNRRAAILTQIVNTDSYVSLDEITEKFRISRRTVYYDMQKINDWLDDHKFKVIKHVRSAGFYLDPNTKKAISNKIKQVKLWDYGYSKKERKAWYAIYLMIRNTPVYVQDLSEKVRAGRSTTMSDLKELRRELLRFCLTLSFNRSDGYVISGAENDKRKAIVYYLTFVLSNQGFHDFLSEIQVLLNSDSLTVDDGKIPALFNTVDLAAVCEHISRCEDELGIELTDEMLQMLAIQICIYSKRLVQGKRITLEPEEKEVLQQTDEYWAVVRLSERLSETLGVTFPEDEICYMTMNFLSAKTNVLRPERKKRKEIRELEWVIKRMVDDFQRYACVTFHDRDHVEKNLMIHLKPAYFRIKYGFQLDNSLTETVKRKYHDVFCITKKVVHHFEALVGITICEDEIAYLAMHFGGSLRREGTEPTRRKKALLVCANGVGTAQILKNQLETLFSTIDIVDSVSSREYNKRHYEVDLVFSTTPLKQKDTPVILVNAILTDSEKETLLKNVNAIIGGKGEETQLDGLMTIIGKYAAIHDEDSLHKELNLYLQQKLIVKESHKPMLNDLIRTDTVLFKSEVSDWEEGIKAAAEPLLDNGSIQEGYVQAMIESVKEHGPYIVLAPKVAVPHARPEQGVDKIGMTLLHLDRPVSFSESVEHLVNIIIVLAAVDKVTHLKALSQLSMLLSDEEKIEELVRAQDKEAVLTLVNEYSS